MFCSNKSVELRLDRNKSPDGTWSGLLTCQLVEIYLSCSRLQIYLRGKFRQYVTLQRIQDQRKGAEPSSECGPLSGEQHSV